jgi:acetyl esterase/lipase
LYCGKFSADHDSFQGFDVPKRVSAILDFYGPCSFASPFWSTKLLPMADRIPKFPSEFLQKVYDEDPVPSIGGVSLEGQASPKGPDFSDPRQAFAMTQIANGTLLDTCFPSKEFKKIDPTLNVDKDFPPTCIVHGTSDTMVPIYLSGELLEAFKEADVEVGMIEVPGEEHTFAGKMAKGSKTWDLQKRGFDFVERVLNKM